MTDQKLVNTRSLTLMGVLLIIFGVLAIATPAVAGTAVVMTIGAVLLIAGIVQIVSGLRSDGWSSKLPPLILGVITSLCGFGLLSEPWIGMKFIALLLAIFFVVEGIRTNIPLHRRILQDEDFLAGRLSTHFMERFLGRHSRVAVGGG